MRLTQTHLDFWESKQIRPRWATRIKRGPAHVNRIDACINAHAGIAWTSRDIAIANLIELCRGCRNRGESLFGVLHHLAVDPGTVINPQVRQRYARRWARRIP